MILGRDFALRPGCTSDLAFVTDTWVKRGCKGERLSDATARVRAILSHASTRLLVAHLPDDPDAILGWAALLSTTPPRLHYAYVRRELRGQGIGRALLSGVPR